LAKHIYKCCGHYRLIWHQTKSVSHQKYTYSGIKCQKGLNLVPKQNLAPWDMWTRLPTRSVMVCARSQYRLSENRVGLSVPRRKKAREESSKMVDNPNKDTKVLSRQRFDQLENIMAELRFIIREEMNVLIQNMLCSYIQKHFDNVPLQKLACSYYHS